jgi:uncharacterized protein (DUF1919 family)
MNLNLNSITLKLRNHVRKKMLSNRDFTIVASNCVGGTIYKDLGLEYKTPFVGLFINADQFVSMCEDFQEIMKLELEEVIDANISYPLGKIGSVVIHFMHYATFEDAKISWNKRKKRMNYANMYFVLSERDKCTFGDLIKFDKLSFTNKIALTKNNYIEIKNSHHIKGYEKESELGQLLDFKNSLSGKRKMYDFNFIKWLNRIEN